MMKKEIELQEQLDALREDLQMLRKQLAAGVGVPDYRPFANGHALTISAGLPTWIAPTTYVGSVTAGAPLASTGGLNSVITHLTSGVAAGTYSYAAITINATGHITAAANGTTPVITVSGNSPITVATSGTTRTVSHANSGVSAGTYAYPTSVTINASGHVTSMSAGSAPSVNWGSIGGTLASQTDLNAALNNRALLSSGNTFVGDQYTSGQFYATGGGAGFAMQSRTTSTVWAMYSTGNIFSFWNSVYGNTFTVTEAGTLTIANVTLSGTLSLPGTTSQYVRGDGSRAAFPSFGSGTVTSVQASGGSTGLTFNGGPISGSGTLTLSGTLGLANGGTGATNAAAARANLGAMSSAGGVFTGAITAPGVTDSSDAKFKSEVRALRGGLDIVRALFPAKFHNRLTDKQEVGFIAQDVFHVLPEVVITDENGDLAVAYQRLTAPIVEALQTIDARLRELEAR